MSYERYCQLADTFGVPVAGDGELVLAELTPQLMRFYTAECHNSNTKGRSQIPGGHKPHKAVANQARPCD